MQFTRSLATIAAAAAVAAGGVTFANAASNSSTTTTPSTQAPPAGQTNGHGGAGVQGRHTYNGKTEQPLTGTTASKVEAAAKAKVPGATVERVETNVDDNIPYEAHMRKSDGSEVTVEVNSAFHVAKVEAMGGPGHP